jgi:hypothetical protein
MVATKVWEFVHPDSLYTPSIGGVQRLPNGNTIINFGNLQWLNMGSIVTEVDSNNQIVFQLEYDNGSNLYRAQKFDWFFFSPSTGCTDLLACNYDPLATIDDGSCYFAPNIQINQVGSNLEVIATGGTTPYVYLWNTLETIQTITPTIIGNYWCVVTDINNCVSDTAFLYVSNIPTIITQFDSNKKKYKVLNVLGKETPFKNNTPLFYIYEDGTVEKKIIIE